MNVSTPDVMIDDLLQELDMCYCNGAETSCIHFYHITTYKVLIVDLR